jgi:N-acylneuraminate cytidylyltransferase
MSNICIIPARGGSKRIPRKNIKAFLGKPIIAYSIEAALASKLFDVVMVSTDDAEIAEIAKSYGAEVPFFRSKENSNDFATTFQVLEEVVQRYTGKGLCFKHVCCLYPCAPFVTAEILKRAYVQLDKEKGKSIFPIVEYPYPIQRALKIEANSLEFNEVENENIRTQDLPKRYHDSGMFYLMETEIILKKLDVVGNSCRALVLENLETQDIDSLSDWKLAELKYKILNKM